MMNFSPRRALSSQSGFNLIEAALVMGIVGIVIGGVFAAWSAVDSQSRLRRGSEQATVIVQQIRTLYGNRRELDSATGAVFTNALMNAEVLPKAWLNDANVLKNPWGGNVIVTPANYTSNVRDGINVTFTQVVKTNCYGLIGSLLGAARTQGLYKIDSTSITPGTNLSSIQGSICGSSTVSLYFSLKSN